MAAPERKRILQDVCRSYAKWVSKKGNRTLSHDILLIVSRQNLGVLLAFNFQYVRSKSPPPPPPPPPPQQQQPQPQQPQQPQPTSTSTRKQRRSTTISPASPVETELTGKRQIRLWSKWMAKKISWDLSCSKSPWKWAEAQKKFSAEATWTIDCTFLTWIKASFLPERALPPPKQR